MCRPLFLLTAPFPSADSGPRCSMWRPPPRAQSSGRRSPRTSCQSTSPPSQRPERLKGGREEGTTTQMALPTARPSCSSRGGRRVSRSSSTWRPTTRRWRRSSTSDWCSQVGQWQQGFLSEIIIVCKEHPVHVQMLPWLPDYSSAQDPVLTGSAFQPKIYQALKAWQWPSSQIILRHCVSAFSGLVILLWWQSLLGSLGCLFWETIVLHHQFV